MQIKTKALIISSLKYGDSSLIVKAFTYSDGIKSYLLKGVLSSRKGKLKPSYFQPLTQLEISAIHKNKGTLERITEARITYAYQTVHGDPSKNAILLFLAEMLSNSIYEEEQNKDLFVYLETTLQWLDTHHSIPNFHIFFLIELTRYLGFYPETSNMDYDYFDLQEGAFKIQTSSNPYITKEVLIVFKRFLGIKFDNIHTIRMSKSLRRELLQAIILFFEVHLEGFKKPRSLAVLNEVFD